ncbi:MAG TPA: protein phosphatase 2C domain-containing protein [Gemmatimonadales bacterium]
MTAGTMSGVDSFGLTDVGKVRTNNEDHFLIATLRKSLALEHTSLTGPNPFDPMKGSLARLYIVADGVGGRPGGELASGTAVQSLVEYIGQTVGCFNTVDVDKEADFLLHLEGSVQRAHERIQEELGEGGGHAPSTTLTMATLVGRRAYIVHVGDSRAYYLHNGKLRQLTEDQTMGRYMVDAGAWTEEQAARAGMAANLTSVLGGSEMLPRIGLVDLLPGDTLLLCTNGLTKHVTDEQLTGILSRAGSAEAACHELVGAALAAGGTDNVTVVVARISD